MSNFDLLNELGRDLSDANAIWQGLAIVVSVVLGWGGARWLQSRKLKQLGEGEQNELVRFGIESLTRVVGPLLAVVFLALAKLILAPWYRGNLIHLALALWMSFAAIRIGFFLLRRTFARQGNVGATIATFERILSLLVWSGLALYITGLWPDVVNALATTKLPIGRHNVSILAIVQAGGSVIVLLMLALWAGAALEERLMKLDTMHSSLRVVTARLGRAVLILVSVLLSLSLVGIDLTVLSVFGGALGVGLGLGLQRIASNYVSGFVILFERSLTIGDMILVDKYYGKVTQINTRYTVIQGLDSIETVLPNEMLMTGAVQNYSLSSRMVRVSTQLTVTYDSDLNALFPELERVTAEVPRVLADPAPSATLNKFGGDGFEIEVGFWILDPENGRGGVTSDVNKRIWEVLQSEQFKLPFPMRDTRFLDARIAAVMAGQAKNG